MKFDDFFAQGETAPVPTPTPPMGMPQGSYDGPVRLDMAEPLSPREQLRKALRQLVDGL